MRLLHLQADGELALTHDLLPHEIPPYAILSHTWGEQEVTFEDIRNVSCRKKIGYRKIDFCGQQAASDGLRYFWVDTCCINKSNHTEYSEAINSMFRWYQNAARCYVYLHDVLRNDPAQTDEDLARPTWKLAFRKSRWFTRGWTLQELIAPSSVEFFSSDGQRLGDKGSLEQAIHEITTVPTRVLQGASLAALGIDERMSWSLKRRTTRLEDRAYSLMGIFGIHMAPIYGEGEDGAFQRLRTEISSRSVSVASLVKRLPIAHGAAFDSHAEEHNPVCLANTRVDLLREITKWAQDPNAKAVYWLNGMAGTGKSTIARTLAHTFSKMGVLGASFFFKRGESDRGDISKFVTTITSQLVFQIPQAAVHIQNALDADPVIFSKAIREQLDKLVMEPLSKVPVTYQTNRTLLVVIDALDECDKDEDAKLLITLLSSAKLQSRRLKVFMTSRPERPIQLGFMTMDGGYQNFELHEIAKPVIEHDITKFLEHELQKIQHDYNNSVTEEERLPLNWPNERNLRSLVVMATPLFIFAATICRFIADERIGTPDEQLEEVLQYQTKSQESQLDATYLPVLNRMVKGLAGRRRNDVLERFRNIVGSIVILATPLSSSALAQILGLPGKQISTALNMLHSVLSIPLTPNQPIRLLHLSFRDFLLDPEKKESPFWVNEREMHLRLVPLCLRTMEKVLRADICEVRDPGTLVSSIGTDKINEKLPPEVQYACQFWPHHLQQAGEGIEDKDQISNFLATHFLHWLEALMWMGKASESLEMIQQLQSLVRPEISSVISGFLNDALRFFLASKFATQKAPLQLYSSALVFAPERSVVRSNFQEAIPSWMLSTPHISESWSQLLHTLEGHRGWVESVAFSPNGRLIASGSRDQTVKLWADTGDLQQTLKTDSTTESLVFSPDSELLATISSERSVQIWATATGFLKQKLNYVDRVHSILFSPNGQIITSTSKRTKEEDILRIWTDTQDLPLTFEGHTDVITSAVFSADGGLVASASRDKTVKLWARTGELQHSLGHNGQVRTVAFSPNGQLIASGSDDHKVRLWTVAGNIHQTLEGHGNAITSVMFSPNGQLIASSSEDRTVRLWETDTGRLKQVFEDHLSGVKSVTFSPDGRFVVAGSENTVWVWAVGGEKVQKPVESHESIIVSITFSPDGRFIASASHDKSVRVWSADTGALQRKLEGHSDVINWVAFSPDGQRIASASDDGTAILWAANTGALQRKLEGHAQGVSTVAFSSDSRLLASGSWDQTIRLWVADTGALHHTLQLGFNGTDMGIYSVAFSPNGHLVASGSDDETVRLWATDTGTLQRTLQINRGSVQAVTFSSNGQFLASVSSDHTVQLWDANTGTLLQSCGIGTWSSYLAFDTANQRILTDTIVVNIKEGLDNIVGYGFSTDRCWLTFNQQNILWLPAECRPGASAIFGSTIAIGCTSGRVAVLRLGEQDL